jgi:outer membrane receptor protein involved in Fe transport
MSLDITRRIIIRPMEAVSRIEMVRGAASLQFGSQFGGMVNYVLNEAIYITSLISY